MTHVPFERHLQIEKGEGHNLFMKKLILSILAIGALTVMAAAWWVNRAFDEALRPFSYHAERIGPDFDPPFETPTLPKTAKDVHIEHSSTLNEESTQVRFSDSKEAIEEFLKVLGLPLEKGSIARKTGTFCSLETPPFEATSLKTGRSYYRHDEAAQECQALVVDDEQQIVFYESTSW